MVKDENAGAENKYRGSIIIPADEIRWPWTTRSPWFA